MSDTPGQDLLNKAVGLIDRATSRQELVEIIENLEAELWSSGNEVIDDFELHDVKQLCELAERRADSLDRSH